MTTPAQDLSALADRLDELGKRNSLDPLGVVPTYRDGWPETEGNIDGWMVCELPKSFDDEPHTEEPFAIGLSRNGADLVALALGNLPTLTAALREAARMREALEKIANHATGGVGGNPAGFVQFARAALESPHG